MMPLMCSGPRIATVPLSSVTITRLPARSNVSVIDGRHGIFVPIGRANRKWDERHALAVAHERQQSCTESYTKNFPPSITFSSSNQMSKSRPTQSMCVLETQFGAGVFGVGMAEGDVDAGDFLVLQECCRSRGCRRCLCRRRTRRRGCCFRPCSCRREIPPAALCSRTANQRSDCSPLRSAAAFPGCRHTSGKDNRRRRRPRRTPRWNWPAR